MLKATAGVLGVVSSDNQCQVIDRQHGLPRLSRGACPVAGRRTGDVPAAKPGFSLRRMGAAILDALIGTMSPLIPAIIGGSMLKLLAMVLEMTGVLEKGSSTLTILTVAGDGAFFFLPLMGGRLRRRQVQDQYVARHRHRRRAGTPQLHRADGQGRRGGAGDLRPDPGHCGEIHLHSDPGPGDDLVPLLHRALGRSHHPGGDQELLEAHADSADCGAARHPAHRSHRHLDLAPPSRAWSTPSTTTWAGCRWPSWGRSGPCW